MDYRGEDEAEEDDGMDMEEREKASSEESGEDLEHDMEAYAIAIIII
jgi:hypothetical protein